MSRLQDVTGSYVRFLGTPMALTGLSVGGTYIVAEHDHPFIRLTHREQWFPLTYFELIDKPRQEATRLTP